MLLTIIVFIALLSLLVFVHEMGHFWVARRFGVKAEEFGFGFPPRAWGIYKTKEGKWRTVKGAKEVTDAADTIYSLNWLPLGGFVKIKGEDGGDKDDPDSFGGKKIWQRAMILSAGVTMNILLAVVLFAVGYMIGLPQAVEGNISGAEITNRQMQIVEVMAGSPAEQAGIRAGDIILSIDGQKIENISDAQFYADDHSGEAVAYLLSRGGERVEKVITPEIIPATGRGGIGIGLVETGTVKYPFFLAIWHGLKSTLIMTWAIIVAFYELFKGLILGQGVGANLSGPVGIAVLTGQVARMGLVYFLQFAALLTINLAIINALPFPALDGGRLLFLAIEKIKGRPVRQELEGAIHYIGFALLMLLVLFVTFKDVARYGDKFKILWQSIIGG